jgi:folate-dependent phosphoribosylglycinamide formyltransferase PurN
VLAAKAEQTGVTVHLVDNDYDRGPIVARWIVPVLPDDDPSSLAARVLEVEHVVYPRAVEMVAALHEHGLVAP